MAPTLLSPTRLSIHASSGFPAQTQHWMTRRARPMVHNNGFVFNLQTPTLSTCEDATTKICSTSQASTAHSSSFQLTIHSNESTLTLYKTERYLITIAIFFVAYLPVFALLLHRANHCLNLPLNECPPPSQHYTVAQEIVQPGQSQCNSLVTTRDEDKLGVTSFTYQHLLLANGEACL